MDTILHPAMGKYSEQTRIFNFSMTVGLREEN